MVLDQLIINLKIFKKRKFNYENRSFNTDWELKYFFINQNEKPICLICNNSVTAFKASNIKRHYDTLHAKIYDNLFGFSREEKFNESKNKLKCQQNFFTKQMTRQTYFAIKIIFFCAIYATFA